MLLFFERGSAMHLFNTLPLLADAGVPMIFLTFPLMVILLVPIILIEAFLYKKWLGLTNRDAMRSSIISNLVSTIIGVPVAWAIMLGVEFGFIGLASQSRAFQNWNSPIAILISDLLASAWIGPPEGAVWAVPCATLVVMVPFFFASYGSEYLVINQMPGMPEGDPSNLTSNRIAKAVRNANLITYGMMAVGTSIWLVAMLLRH
jgi:hypothetical protein